VIAFLRGRILDKQPNRLTVDVNGVGYDVSVPLSTFYGLGEPGTEVSLRVHTHVREDALALYGFASRLEQDLFERLIGISGIGPKVALAVLSGIEPGGTPSIDRATACAWNPAEFTSVRATSARYRAWNRRRTSKLRAATAVTARVASSFPAR